MSYEVTAPVAVIRVGDSEHYCYRGQRIADAPLNVEHLLAAGLIEKIETEPAADPDPEPESKPLEDMTLAELRDHAVRSGISLDGASTKAETIAKIRDHKA